MSMPGSTGPRLTLLDKELQKVVRDAALGRCWADSLVR